MQHSDLSNQQFSNTEVAELLSLHYGIEGNSTPLAGEVDFNFKVETTTNQTYTLKISRPETKPAAIEFEIAVLNHLQKSAFPLHTPINIQNLDNQAFISLKNGQFLRLQTWIEGRMLGDVNPRSVDVLKNWGLVCGQLSKAMQGFDHPFAHRFYKWNPSETLFSKKNRVYIKDKNQLEIADYCWDLFEMRALPHLADLRKSVNYNDAHEHNLLVDFDLQNPKITGLIDVGDALYTETINELAIACAYAMMAKPDPIAAAAAVVGAYHKIFPLEEQELEVLFPLICARLMITVSAAALNKHQEPDNEYLLISEKPAWNLLKKLRQIAPNFAYYSFRHACGLVPAPQSFLFETWLRNQEETFAQVVDFQGKTVVAFDLSVGSLDLGNNSKFDTIQAFEKNVSTWYEEKNADIGVGGYGEVRPIYTTEAYKVEGNKGVQWRTVHLGLDVWAAAETPIFAPLDGKVHSFQNNAAERDYGPCILLEHHVSADLTFYTLYGHLSADSLDGLTAGQVIKKGQAFCKIGPAPVNGNWPPHLHFQVLLDTLGNKGDFPGVAFPDEAAIWLSICPNPACFFEKLPAFPSVFSMQEILEKRKEKLGRSLSISYKKPLYIQRAYMQYLYDHTGRRYLDTVNNVPHVGHQHPKVVRAAQRQMELLNTNTRYVHENITHFAEELLATLPPELSVVHVVNSGSEANELAIRMARAYTGQKDMIAVEVGYHGNTNGCIDISSYKFDGKGGKGAPPLTHIVPIPDLFRGHHREVETAGLKYAEYVETTLSTIQAEGRNVCAYICEGISSCGGQIVMPPGYWEAVYAKIRAAGGLCIADEVQTGFGRMGSHFWSFELQNVVPDIVTMGKPIGNGHPLAAVVCTKEVAEAFANGMEYFNTFGGNPVSCAIGSAVLQTIKDDNLQENALKTGAYLLKGLQILQARFPLIGDVRGIGLFLGFELVEDKITLKPATRQASYLSNRMRERGLLMSTDGPFENVLKIKPPMCFSKTDADFLLENLEMVLGEDFLRTDTVISKK